MGPFPFRRKASPVRHLPARLPEHHRDVDAIARQCRRLVTQRAMVSATAAVVPLPGLDVLVDVGVLARMLEEINGAFGLTPMQIEQLEAGRRISVYRVLKSLGDSAVGRAVTRDVLALGYTEWRTALRVIGPAALPGITTGVVVAIARIAGETAPLLFTAFGNPFWSLAPTEPIAAVPLQVYTYALSPYETWQRQAWAAALVLVLTVGGLTFVGRSIAAKRGRRA